MTSDIQIIDNLLPKQYQDHIEETLTNSFFPLYFNKKTLPDNNKEEYDVPQFTHTFYKLNDPNNTSQWWPEIKPLFYFLEDKTGLKTLEIVRVKANFLLKNSVNIPNPLHPDVSDPEYFSLLYYVNESDGDTYFYKDYSKSVSPKKGRAVFFRSNILHAGSNPVQSDYRIVINIIGKFK